MSTLCERVLLLEQCVAFLKAQPQSVYALQKTFVKRCLGISGATVDVSGNIVNKCGNEDFNIVRTATGLYEITPPPGALFAHIEAIEGPITRDSIEAHMGTSFTGGTAHISEGDNGAAPGGLRDRPFSIIWFGDVEVLDQTILCKDGVPVADKTDPLQTPGVPSLGPANGKIVVDTFLDQVNTEFRLQVRNTTSLPIAWEALHSNVPYGVIPGLSYPVETTANTNGTFNHLFKGTGLQPFSNIVISGDIVSPPGDNTRPELFCETE